MRAAGASDPEIVEYLKAAGVMVQHRPGVRLLAALL
jgi:hypothetical protein